MKTGASTITIDVLAPSREAEYEQFLLRQPASLIYHSIRFRNFLQDLLGCDHQYLIATVNGEIRGALPLLVASGRLGSVYNSLPYYGSNGGIMADDQATFRELVSAYNDIVTSAGVLASTIVPNPFGDEYVVLPTHTFEDMRISQSTTLPVADGSPEDSIGALIDSSARRNVAKARNEGVIVSIDAHCIPELQTMHVAGMKAIGGTAKTPRFFDLLDRHFRAGVDYDIYVARKDGRTIAALLTMYFNATVEYYMPASDPDARTAQPLSAILMVAMADAVRRGFRVWNWGGTWQSQVGVYRFKKKWGARDKPYLYYTSLNDAAILAWPKEEIVQAYPGFFVVPFATLRGGQ